MQNFIVQVRGAFNNNTVSNISEKIGKLEICVLYILRIYGDACTFQKPLSYFRTSELRTRNSFELRTIPATYHLHHPSAPNQYCLVRQCLQYCHVYAQHSIILFPIVFPWLSIIFPWHHAHVEWKVSCS